MNEQTRIRLGLATKRYEQRLSQMSETDAGWLSAFERVCREIVRTAMAEIGAELVRAGHSCQIDVGDLDGRPSLDWTVAPRAVPTGRRMVRVFPRHDEQKGWEVLAEIWLSGTPCELRRFASPAELTAEVAENLLVEAVEQILAAAGSGAIFQGEAATREAVPPLVCRDYSPDVPAEDLYSFVGPDSGEVTCE